MTHLFRDENTNRLWKKAHIRCHLITNDGKGFSIPVTILSEQARLDAKVTKNCSLVTRIRPMQGMLSAFSRHILCFPLAPSLMDGVTCIRTWRRYKSISQVSYTHEQISLLTREYTWARKWRFSSGLGGSACHATQAGFLLTSPHVLSRFT